MATLTLEDTNWGPKWRVRWRAMPAGTKSRMFRTEREARSFMATVRDERPDLRARRSTGAQIIARSVVVNAAGCWIWQKSLNENGYGCTSAYWDGQRRPFYAHRLSYMVHVGPIPEGMHLDHLCRVVACCNPAHLEAVTPTENARRGLAAFILNTGRCIAGHRMDEANTRIYVSKNGRTRRICRECHRQRNRKSAAVVKAATRAEKRAA